MLCVQDSAARSSWSQTHSPRSRFSAMLCDTLLIGIRTGQVMDCHGDGILLSVSQWFCTKFISVLWQPLSLHRFDECLDLPAKPSRLSASLHPKISQVSTLTSFDIPPIAAWHLHGMCRQLLFGGSRSQLIAGLFDGPSQICQQTLQGAAWWDNEHWMDQDSTFEVPKAAVFVMSFLSKFHKVFECSWDWPWNVVQLVDSYIILYIYIQYPILTLSLRFHWHLASFVASLCWPGRCRWPPR